MAKAITERTLIGLNKNISPNIYLQEDLIDKLDQNNFQEIQDNMAIKIKNNEIIHFDAIVGNPPYSKLDSPTNPLSHTPIYPKFVELAIKLQPKYFSYIIPKT
ncbi:Eco57I restriction-modification methylase domain-containing protein [bacterium]|nr:Eco57I restriction-modification methylase domain-containing protein [bacterium]